MDTIDVLLEEMRQHAQQHHTPISSPESIHDICILLRQYQPKRCLEIGTCVGFGTICIARVLQERWGQIDSFDVSLPSFILAQSYISRSGLSNIRLFLENFLWQTSIKNKKYDFIYIDAQKSRYVDFLMACRAVMHNDTQIMIDDVYAFPIKTKPLWDFLNVHSIGYTLHRHQDGDAMISLIGQDLLRLP